MGNSIIETKVILDGCNVVYTSDLSVINCGICGGTYALSRRYVVKRREHGGCWTCPYCATGWGYSKENSEIEKLKKQLQNQTDATKDQRLRKEELFEKCGKLERSRNGMKGVLRREQNRLARVKNGTCPCCKRHFKNLERHMKGKHPNFKPGDKHGKN